MKRLKLRVPFRGSDLPVYLAAGLLIAALILFPRLPFSEPVIIAAVAAVPFITLIVSFLICQRLSPEERAIAEKCDPPQWIPLPAEYAAVIAKEKGHFQPRTVTIILISLIVGAVIYAFAALATALAYGHLPLILIAAGTAVFLFFVMLLVRANHRKWAEIVRSETAQCILVPIHSKQYQTSGKHCLGILITIYLPDGRYMLPCKGTRDGDTAAIIKYRGSFIWMIVPRDNRRKNYEPCNDPRTVCQKDQTVQ